MPRHGGSETRGVAVRLRLLGGLRVADVLDRPLRLPTRKAGALLAYLALPPGPQHTRAALATLLWGRTTDARARNSLRQTVFALRRALEPLGRELLIQDGSALRVDPTAVDVDAVAFETAALGRDYAALEDADALWRGELLAGMEIDEPTFEEWLAAERQRLGQLARSVLARLLAHQAGANAGLQAIGTATRLLRLDPLQEEAHRTLMRLHAQQGRRTDALRQYRTCAELLARELSVRPEPATGRLREEIERLETTGRQRALRPATPECADAGSSTILVVEDDPSTRAMLEGMLRSASYDVVVAGDGRAALQELARRRFDLVVSDVRMPSIDGFTLLEAMNRDRLPTPAMLVTSGADVALEARGLALGAEDYIRKPISRDVLLLRVANVLRRRR